MRPGLRAIADRNGGVFTRKDAVASGYTERELKTLTGHRGAWVVLRRGAYAEREVYDACAEDGRYLLRVRAAAVTMRRDAVMTHSSAAATLGMPTRPRWHALVHTTRPDVRGSRTENGVKHHLGSLDEGDLVLVAGLRVTGPARTGADVGREFGFEDGVVGCDAALRLGATRADLARVLDVMTHWPDVTNARAAVRVADGGAETIGESLLRVMLLELDIGVPETQFVVSDGNRTTYVDLRVGPHLFEFDGRIKYVERERGGVADRPVNEIVWSEKKREDWVRRTSGDLGMSRVIWTEMFGAERARTKRRLYAEFMESVRRHGGAAT